MCLFSVTFHHYIHCGSSSEFRLHGVWSGGAMVLGKFPVPGRPTIWMVVGQGPFALAAGAGGGCLDICTVLYLFSSISSSLWKTARYGLKYCLKGPFKRRSQLSLAICYYFCPSYYLSSNYKITVRFTI